jgi:hypothetical protein
MWLPVVLMPRTRLSPAPPLHPAAVPRVCFWFPGLPASGGSKTPEVLSQETRARVLAERQALERLLINRNLAIPLREGLPSDFGKGIVEFNTRVGEFLKRSEELAEGRAALSLAMADPKLSGQGAADKAQKVRGERYDVLKLHLKLLTARKSLLDALIPHVEKECEALEERLREAEQKMAAGLKSLGWVPFPARGGRAGVNPKAEERAFAAEVRAQPGIRAAQGAVQAARAEIDGLRRQAKGVKSDVAVLEEQIAVAWGGLTGGGK